MLVDLLLDLLFATLLIILFILLRMPRLVFWVPHMLIVFDEVLIKFYNHVCQTLCHLEKKIF